MCNELINSIGNPALLQTRGSLRRWMTWDRNLPDDMVAALWDSPENLLGHGECLQTKSRTTVARVDVPPGPYLLKFHHWAGFWKMLSKSRATSPNRLSFDLGLQLADRGVPTPRPLACVDVRLGPLNVCSYLLTDFVEGTSLYRRLRYDRPDSATIDDLARQVARIWQVLDDARLSHNDLKPENFMIDPSGRVWLIDLENARWHKDTVALRQCQAEDAKRILHARSWQANPAAAEVFRQRLLVTPAVQTAIAEPGGAKHPLAQGAEGSGIVSQRLTVLIPCNNATAELSGCVGSVRDFADEIVLAIPDGNDRAWDIVENLPDCRGWWCERFDDQTLRDAINAARNPWVLVLEPSERVSPDLAKEIQFLLAENPSKDGYRIGRRNYLFGRMMRFGDAAGHMPVRLVRRDGPVLPSVDGVHDEKPPHGDGKLRGRIFRYRASNVRAAA
jgi:serine/threonine protein kinase